MHPAISRLAVAASVVLVLCHPSRAGATSNSQEKPQKPVSSAASPVSRRLVVIDAPPAQQPKSAICVVPDSRARPRVPRRRRWRPPTSASERRKTGRRIGRVGRSSISSRSREPESSVVRPWTSGWRWPARGRRTGLQQTHAASCRTSQVTRWTTSGRSLRKRSWKSGESRRVNRIGPAASCLRNRRRQAQRSCAAHRSH